MLRSRPLHLGLFVLCLAVGQSECLAAVTEAEARAAKTVATNTKGLAAFAKLSAEATIAIVEAHPNYGAPGFEDATALIFLANQDIAAGELLEIDALVPMVNGDIALMLSQWGVAKIEFNFARDKYLAAAAKYAAALAKASEALFILSGVEMD